MGTYKRAVSSRAASSGRPIHGRRPEPGDGDCHVVAVQLPPTREEGPMPDPAAQSTERTSDLPRVLAFYKDTWDDDGTAVGWTTVAWGLALPDGGAVTVPLEGQPSATLWLSVSDAAEALAAYVDTPTPARRLDEASPDRDVRSSTTSALRSSSGSGATQPACSPVVAAAGEDRRLGRDQPGVER
jgi:hypothetical protein